MEHSIIHVAIAVIVVSTPAMLLRFWSRGLALKGRYALDDWLALLAWVGVMNDFGSNVHIGEC